MQSFSECNSRSTFFPRGRASTGGGCQKRVLLLIALAAILSGCSTVANTKPVIAQTKNPHESDRSEREAIFSAKIRCADAGWKLAAQEPPVPHALTKFAYNEKMNTCLLEVTYINKQGRRGFITDVLTNELLGMYSVVADSRQWTQDDREVVMAFNKLEADLFPASNASR